MKTLIITFLISAFAFAQEGFRAEGNTIIWERVFPAGNAEILALLNSRPDLKVTSFAEDVYKGTSDKMKNSCAGGSVLMKNDCKFDFIITITQGHYVVTVTNLKILEKYGPMQARVIANSCEKYFLDGNALRRDAKSYADLSCLNNFLSSTFSGIPVVKTSGALTSNK